MMWECPRHRHEEQIFVDPPQNGWLFRIIPFAPQYLWITLDEPDQFVVDMNKQLNWLGSRSQSPGQ
jgi:hypothetical protein